MLEVEQLSVFYGSIHALQDISLKVAQGELVALLGANGAGKSTTLRTISGLLRPKNGRVLFNNKNITGEKSHKIVASGVIHVPEGRQIFGRLSVAENLRLGAYQRKDRQGIEEDRKWVYSLFPILQERKNQVAGTLSGGEQQMLAIARGLMGRPRLLLLDEPSLGLAPVICDKIFDVIQKLKERGMTTLLVEQNAFQALAVADRAYVLETGHIKVSGPSQQLLHDSEVKKAYLGG